MASHPVSKLTEEQYLAIERAAEFKSEFFDGEMFAMSGASMNHGRLQRNILVELDHGLRGKGCEAFPSDLRVKVSSRMYTYPDISVVCGDPLLADEHQDNLLNPVALFEILSPSTEKYDRGLKFRLQGTVRMETPVSMSWWIRNKSGSNALAASQTAHGLCAIISV